MRTLASLLIALAFAGAARADVHPRYHEANKAAAAAVVVLAVRVVIPEIDGDGMGECLIEGAVSRVERGRAAAIGDDVALTVPCFTEDAQLPSSGIQWQEMQALVGSNHGRVWLDGRGEQIEGRYYQIID